MIKEYLTMLEDPGETNIYISRCSFPGCAWLYYILRVSAEGA